MGYMMTTLISVALLAILIISSSNFMRDSSDMVTTQSFDVIGSNLALKITNFDSVIRSSAYTGGFDTSFSTEFAFPREIVGREYSINVTDYGSGTSPRYEVILRSEEGSINEVRTPLNISTAIGSGGSGKFSSYQEEITISYNATTRQIELA